ncbi:MAG TPA: hypothetical protein VJT15_15170 [Pyrinomonadaceae bacterium]|nr:hypothetical protein [Pyrinomonadaceae bacterium]
MYKNKLFSLGAVLLLAVATSGCCVWPFCSSGGGSQPQTGFTASGEAYVQVVGGGFFFNNLTTVRGAWQSDNGTAQGNTTTFSECCGPRHIPNGRVPARWQISAGVPGECIGQLTNPNVDLQAGGSFTAKCLIPGIIFPFATAPGAVDLMSPPATMEMTGTGLVTTYGMPRIEYRDPYNGALVAVTTATQVRKGGWLTMTTPDLSAVYSGTYNVFVSNVTADGGYEQVGGGTVDTYGRDYVYEPPPPPGGCGCPPDGPCLECEILAFRSAPPERDWGKLILGNLILR